MTISYPTEHTSFVQWRDELQLLRPDLTMNPRVNKEDDWQWWVNYILQNNLCQKNGSPRAEGFNNWRDWANAFINSFGQNL